MSRCLIAKMKADKVSQVCVWMWCQMDGTENYAGLCLKCPHAFADKQNKKSPIKFSTHACQSYPCSDTRVVRTLHRFYSN